MSVCVRAFPLPSVQISSIRLAWATKIVSPQVIFPSLIYDQWWIQSIHQLLTITCYGSLSGGGIRSDLQEEMKQHQQDYKESRVLRPKRLMDGLTVFVSSQNQKSGNHGQAAMCGGEKASGFELLTQAPFFFHPLLNYFCHFWRAQHYECLWERLSESVHI